MSFELAPHDIVHGGYRPAKLPLQPIFEVFTAKSGGFRVRTRSMVTTALVALSRNTGSACVRVCRPGCLAGCKAADELGPGKI